jgi:hypothetical protein
MNSIGIRDGNKENLNDNIYKSKNLKCDEMNLELRFK